VRLGPWLRAADWLIGMRVTGLVSRLAVRPAGQLAARLVPRSVRTKGWPRRVAVALLVVASVAVLAVAGSVGWTLTASSGHRHTLAEAPSAPVALVFGAQLEPGGRAPRPFLASRLNAAAALLREGRVRMLLVTGDARGQSGDEVGAMTRYLVARGVPASQIQSDPAGLDTYDSCWRAYHLFGVRSALLVSQDFHLPRAVALCRADGMDAEGVDAGCAHCSQHLLRNRLRELPASVKALFDRIRNRPAAVQVA
jgi:SanA protein